MPAAKTYDVAIVGGGIAGLSLAAIFGRLGLSVLIADRQSPEVLTADAYDGRTTAISLGSRRVLERAGVWDALAPLGEPIETIRIADNHAPEVLRFNAREVGQDPFGHIFDNRDLRLALIAALKDLKTVTFRAPCAVTGYDRAPGAISVTLDDGSTAKACLLIGADGRGSPTRDWAGIETDRWTYRQSAIVFQISHDRPHGQLALEHFLPDGPLAQLPMPDDEDGRHRSSIVWTVRKRDAKRRATQDAALFNHALQAGLGDYLGAVRVEGPRWVYPLSVLHAKSYVAPRLALVNEAAHAMHPIAGQGLNVGMRDIDALADLVEEARDLGLDIGNAALLQRYERRRRPDTVAMIAATDTLNRLFSNDLRSVGMLRRAGLAAVERLYPAKRFFMRHAMGLSTLAGLTAADA